MELFKTLSEALGEGCSVTLTIAQKDGQMTVSVLPGNSIVKDAAKNNIVPLTIVGTPDEIDEGICQTIAQPIEKACGVLSNMAEYEKAVEEAKAKSKMEEERKNAAAKIQKDFTAWMELAKTNLKDKKYRDARTCLKEAEAIAPDDKSKSAVTKLDAEIEQTTAGDLFGGSTDLSDGKNVKIDVKPAKSAKQEDCDADDCDE